MCVKTGHGCPFMVLLDILNMRVTEAKDKKEEKIKEK